MPVEQRGPEILHLIITYRHNLRDVKFLQAPEEESVFCLGSIEDCVAQGDHEIRFILFDQGNDPLFEQPHGILYVSRYGELKPFLLIKGFLDLVDVLGIQVLVVPFIDKQIDTVTDQAGHQEQQKDENYGQPAFIVHCFSFPRV